MMVGAYLLLFWLGNPVPLVVEYHYIDKSECGEVALIDLTGPETFSYVHMANYCEMP